MAVSTPLETARDRFVADARALAPGEEDARITALRAEALETFESSGLPHTRLEDWRYTSLLPLARLAPGLAPPAVVPTAAPPSRHARPASCTSGTNAPPLPQCFAPEPWVFALPDQDTWLSMPTVMQCKLFISFHKDD